MSSPPANTRAYWYGVKTTLAAAHWAAYLCLTLWYRWEWPMLFTARTALVFLIGVGLGGLPGAVIGFARSLGRCPTGGTPLSTVLSILGISISVLEVVGAQLLCWFYVAISHPLVSSLKTGRPQTVEAHVDWYFGCVPFVMAAYLAANLIPWTRARRCTLPET